MDDLTDALKKIYIEKLTKAFSPEKLLIFIIYTLGQIYLSQYNTDGSFTAFLTSIRLQSIFDFENGPIPEVTIGNVFLATFLTIFSSWTYRKLIKNPFFIYLSSKRGFQNYIDRWMQNTETIVSERSEYNVEIAKTLKKKTDAKISVIIQWHLFGEIFLSLFFTILASLTSFNSYDFAFCMLILMVIIWLQRYAYVFYISEILPLVIAENSFLRKDFSHLQVLSDRLSIHS